MRAYVLVHVQTGREREVVNSLKGTAGVIRADITFGTYDVIAEVEATSLAAIGRLVFEMIRCQPGVNDTLTCLAIE